MRRPTPLLALFGTVSLVACGGPGAAPLSGYTIDAVVSHERDDQGIGFLFGNGGAQTKESCADLTSAAVRFNGVELDGTTVISRGGWDPVFVNLTGADECFEPYVEVEIPATSSGSGLLEIQDPGGPRFAVELADVLVQVRMELTSVAGRDVEIAVQAPFAGEPSAWLRDNVEDSTTDVDSVVLEGEVLRVTLPAARTDRMLHVRLDGDPTLAECAGFAGCRAIRGAYWEFDVGAP